MAKQTGLGSAFWVDGVDVSGDINALNTIGQPLAALDFTGIDKFAFEKQGGKKDGVMDFVSFFNFARAHPVLSTLPLTDRLMTWALAPALGSDAATLNCKQINYDPTRDQDGNLTLAVEGQANQFGLEWGLLATPGKRTDSTATTPGTGVDLGVASTSFGWQAYVHLFAFAGTSVTLTLQDSADNSTFANLTGGAFTAISSAPATQRLASASPTATVREFLRVVSSGTFSNAQFAVLFVRNQASVVF